MRNINNICKQSVLFFLYGLFPLALSAQNRSVESAMSIAQDFYYTRFSADENVNLCVRKSSELDGSKISTTAKEAFYIFQGGKNNFVIVSGDERMPKVLAYSETNGFDFNNIPPAVRYWLDCYEEAMLCIGDTSESIALAPCNATVNGVEPLLEDIKWWQNDPYNRMCPSYHGEKCLTGCVATAMAQVMKFYNYPDRGRGFANYITQRNNIRVTRNISDDVFDWPNMLASYSNSFSEKNATAVSTLMASCGASVKMDYGTSEQDGSGAYQTDLLSAYVDNFKYDPDAAVLDRRFCSITEWHELLIAELNEGRPVNYAGHSARDGGHSFVIDGYRNSSTSKFPDYHVNWGWNGSCDGYYQIADLQPQEGGYSYTRDGFNSSQQMTIRIKPDDQIDERFCCIGTEKLRSSLPWCTAGTKLTLSTSSLYNFGYRTINGKLFVAMVSEDNDVIETLGTKVISLQSLEGARESYIEFCVPDYLEDGVYKLQLMFEDVQDKKHTKVYSSSYPELIISSTGDNPIPPSYTSSTLGCSDAEFYKNKNDNYEINVRIYELQNLEMAPFMGEISMLISDNTGLGFVEFGNPVQTDEMETNYVLPDPIQIKGKIVGEWPDGHYRIYFGARPIGASEYTLISFYDQFDPTQYPGELFFDATIKNGEITIGSQHYEIVPTSIEQVKEFRQKTRTYLLDGREYVPSPSNSQRLVLSNGKKLLLK